MVDDNQMGLGARRDVFEELGYRVLTVPTPSEALASAAGSDIALVITDYKMDGMTGVELIKALRGQQYIKPIILLSGFAETLGLNEQNTGADAVIQKSANEVPHLIRAVNTLLKRAQGRRPPSSYNGRSGPRRRKPA